MRRGLLPALLFLCIGAVTAAAHADTLTYTVTSTASGSLDGTSFTNALVTITGSADSSTVTSPSTGIYFNVASSTVTVAGIGTTTFTDAIEYVSNQGGADPALGGVSDLTSNLALLLLQNSAFSSYDLTTTFGPVSGSPIFNSGSSYATDLGSFIINSSGNATFTVTDASITPAVPEPSSLVLLTTGLVGFAGAAKRKMFSA